MATSSIFQRVSITDKRRIAKLVRAIERSKASNALKTEEMKPLRPVSDMTKEQIARYF